MAGYPPEVIRDFAERFGPKDPIAKAEEKARGVPGFDEEIRRVEAEINWLSTLLREPPGRREELEGERRSLVVEALAEGATSAQSASTSKRGPGRRGKDYSGKAVEEVVRQATAGLAAGGQLGRTLRDTLAANVDGMSAYAVDMAFALMRAGDLADAGREGWLKIDGELSATPATLNLRDRLDRL
jgi:hypothetical protein